MLILLRPSKTIKIAANKLYLHKKLRRKTKAWRPNQSSKTKLKVALSLREANHANLGLKSRQA